MPRKDFEKFLKIVQKKMGDKYLVLNAKTCPAYPLMTTRLVKRGTVFIEEVMKDVDCPSGIFLDLYVLDNVSDNPVMYQVQSWTAWFFSKLMILRAIPKPTLHRRWEGKADLVGLRPGLQQHETALHFAGRPEKAVRGGMQAV